MKLFLDFWFHQGGLFFFLRCLCLALSHFPPAPNLPVGLSRAAANMGPFEGGTAGTIEYFFHGCQLQEKKKRALLLLSRRWSSFSV